MDIEISFLHKDLEHEVFLKKPTSFVSEELHDHVYQLDKVIYKLNQAPMELNDTLATYLLQNGYKRGFIDNTMFIKECRLDIILDQGYVSSIIFDQKMRS